MLQLPDQPTILDKITDQTREDLIRRKKKHSMADFRSFPLYGAERKDFRRAIIPERGVSVIAEVKKASPSKGIIRKNFNPLKTAEWYAEAGASGISVLTDEPFFKGSLNYLQDIRKASELPLLRKDFIVDFYQIEEARAYGADAVLLIATITSGSQLSELHHAATEAGLQCLVECYDEKDFDQVDYKYIDILGVNNRNLKTFEVDLHRGIKLLQSAPDHVIKVSESGLSKTEDLKLLADEGIHSALIGESLMREKHPGDALKKLLEPFRED